MATIAQTVVTGVKTPVVVTKTTLTSSDTFSYSAGTGQVLELTNGTGGSLTVNIDGSGSTTIQPDGMGQTVDVSAGFNIVLTAGVTKAVPLDSIKVWLIGTIAVTGGTGITASITV